MILWTIQNVIGWDTLKRTGLLRGSSRYIDNDFAEAYQWLSDQMHTRIGPKPAHDTWPVWAWYQWEGERKKPDLRQGGLLRKGESGVRIEFEVDDKMVLLSDFDLWHYVLNYWYLPRSEKDGRQFEAILRRHNLSFYRTTPLPNKKFYNDIVDSWQRIFDLDWSAKGISDRRSKKSIQATLWEIRYDYVRNAKEFIAR